ncbi:hypothetical protein RB195_004902 [Necator americanus]
MRQGAVAGPFLFNFAFDYLMRRTVDNCLTDIALEPLTCPLTDLNNAVDVVIFVTAQNFTMLSILYRSYLQPADYVYALINADVSLFETPNETHIFIYQGVDESFIRERLRVDRSNSLASSVT